MRAPPGHRDERFRALFEQTYPAVLGFVQRRTDPDDAQDVAAEAFLVAWRRFDDVPTRPGDARAWLFGVARHCLSNQRRGRNRRDALAVRIASATPSPGADLDDPELVARRIDLAAAWHRLTDAEQEVISLAVFDDLTSPQAAQVLGTTAAAYRLRLSRARRALRDHLDAGHRAPAPAVCTVQEIRS
ncbi:MAG: sigma-70 family RNA polymerase sigma factor [Dermatophilaceae bacterium]